MMSADQLKNSILQLAMQGKLVEQRPEEGTGEKLYIEIQEEKKSLIKKGKLKKQKSFPNITEDEVPFDIPTTWKWVYVGTVINLLSGSDLASNKYNSAGKGIVYITGASNIENGSIVVNRWTEFPNNIAHKGDLLLTCKGTVGKTAILQLEEAHIARQIMAITPILCDINYFNYYIQFTVNDLKKKAKSMIPGIERANVLNSFLPLPPLDEQKRIVAKIEELMPYVEQYAEASTKLNTLNASFPDMIKKSILQEAVQGKLVPQDPNDELASELLKRIAEEKQKLIKEGAIKKHKELPEITEDEIPFDIPESWEWVRLQKLALAIVDCPHSTPKYLDEITGYYALGTKGIGEEGRIRGFFNIDKNTYLKRIERLEPRENDIVYSREGSIICRAAILPGNMNICLGQRVMLIRCPEGIMPEYLQQYLMTDSTITVLTKNYKGVGVKHINVADVCKLPVPVPPVNEQKRIVDIIRDVFPLIKTINV